FQKMDQRIGIKFCVKNKIKCADAFRMLTVAYGEATLDRSNVYRWYKMFSEGREDVNNEERAGRPSMLTTDENIDEVKKIVLANRRITVREVAEDLNISIGSCHSIFTNDLGMRRVTAKFIPKLLNFDQKQHCINIARASDIGQRRSDLSYVVHSQASVRRAYMHAVLSGAPYGAPVWSGKALASCRIKQRLHSMQRRLALRICRAYRTVSYTAAMGGGVVTPMTVDRLRGNVRRRVFEEWRATLENDPPTMGARTVEAILPCLEQWIGRGWGGLSFHTTQMLTGHGCFGEYLCRIGKEPTASCHHCDGDRDTAQHTLEAWAGERGVLVQVDRRTVNIDWCTTICLPEVINELRRTNRNRRIILHHEKNASYRTARQTVDFFIQYKCELMTHCPYSPDLSSNDFFLFPNIKKKMRGERFKSPEAAVEAFRTLISEVTASEWKKCFENWFERKQKCIDLKGEYFEKQ
ncbi:SETMR methyltransferase, partial [Pseudoatta argentina]